MRLDIFVEEPSAEVAMRHLVPKVIGSHADVRILLFQGKYQLLKKLPDRLKTYSHCIGCGDEVRVLILVDRDRDDCQDLKNLLESMSRQAGLDTKTAPSPDGIFHVVNRIAVEELEAWFLGDSTALRTAFPRLSEFSKRARYRHPDAIKGGTWEALHGLLQSHGECGDIYPKIKMADKIARHMEIQRNRSPSFQCFCEGLRALVA